jgi:hypothetical protein
MIPQKTKKIIANVIIAVKIVATVIIAENIILQKTKKGVLQKKDMSHPFPLT